MGVQASHSAFFAMFVDEEIQHYIDRMGYDGYTAFARPPACCLLLCSFAGVDDGAAWSYVLL